nr:MAG TPA: hypothetical protein [Caudoviricetes sp.]
MNIKNKRNNVFATNFFILSVLLLVKVVYTFLL